MDKKLLVVVDTSGMMGDGRQRILEEYGKPLGIVDIENIQILGIPKGKLLARQNKEILTDIIEEASDPSIDCILILSSPLFKYITKIPVSNASISSHKEIKQPIFGAYNYMAAAYNDSILDKIKVQLSKLKHFLNNGSEEKYTKVNVETIHTKEELLQIIPDLKAKGISAIGFDIETTSLKFYEAELVSIAIGTSPTDAIFLYVYDDRKLQQAVKEFLILAVNNNMRLVFHKAMYDCKIIIYRLWMNGDLENIEGLTSGIREMFFVGKDRVNNIEDTLLLEHTTNNTTSKNSYKLKDLLRAKYGNYGVDIKNIFDIALPDLTVYNGTDASGTLWLYQGKPKTEEVYVEIFKPSVPTILFTELIGMPINKEKVLELQKKLKKMFARHLEWFNDQPMVQYMIKDILRVEECAKVNKKLKVKVVYPEDPRFDSIVFNPNSNKQIATLLYREDTCGLSTRRKTPAGAYSTSSDTLRELIVGVKESSIQNQILARLLDIADISIILNNFVHSLLEYSVKKGDIYYLFGSFSIPGTMSGRLSSSRPNLQNMPERGNRYAKDLKACFIVPPGYLMPGADYSSLEDRISAITTRDPNKEKVYTDGYDSHSLRSTKYYANEMPDIIEELEKATNDADRVRIVNSVAERYPNLRQRSKQPTFALTYMGTWKTLVSKGNLPKKEAVHIENSFKEMYSVSMEWCNVKIEIAKTKGYVVGAFGFKLHSAPIKNYVNSNQIVEADIRTLNNMLGQSWGMLNNRSTNAVIKHFLFSKYCNDVLPMAQIHDASYYLLKADWKLLVEFNRVLTKEMRWKKHPQLRESPVELKGNLFLYYKDKRNLLEFPENFTESESKQIVHKYIKGMKNK